MSEKDMKVVSCSIKFRPISLRVPLKFGHEFFMNIDSVFVKMNVRTVDGSRTAQGWGESPLSPAWAWPSTISFAERLDKMRKCCERFAGKWNCFTEVQGHAMEIGTAFLDQEFEGPEPLLTRLTCNAAFDLALHDAYGKLHDIDVYKTYNAQYMNRDLESYFNEPEFAGKYPEDFFVKAPSTLPVWHLVGGKDPLSKEELTGNEPKDGYPVLLEDWIAEDGLKCLKIKLTGNDADWDFNRIKKVGEIAQKHGIGILSTDFNCTVKDPEYVNGVLDRLKAECPAVFDMILYVEQPFPYDLETNMIDVHSVSARKPLFMDESAHNWHLVKLGRSLGWTGVALKTCKTQTGALLSACWAKAHGMKLMVQDLTNPCLAMFPHVRLAAHVGTIMGVESNAVQFYPAASAAEAKIHFGLFNRRNGVLDLSTIKGPGFGMREKEIYPKGDIL